MRYDFDYEADDEDSVNPELNILARDNMVFLHFVFFFKKHLFEYFPLKNIYFSSVMDYLI